MTNFDRIKNMSVEEFADEIVERLAPETCLGCLVREYCNTTNQAGACKVIIKRWLNSKVKEKKYYLNVTSPLKIDTSEFKVGDKINLVLGDVVCGICEISGFDDYSITYKVAKDVADMASEMIEKNDLDRQIYSIF